MSENVQVRASNVSAVRFPWVFAARPRASPMVLRRARWIPADTEEEADVRELFMHIPLYCCYFVRVGINSEEQTLRE